MIRSWASSPSRRFFEQGKDSPFRGLDSNAAHELLAVLDAATSLADIGALRSVGLHKLKGSRSGQWAITVNARWRICFRLADGDAYDVEIVDYHKG